MRLQGPAVGASEALARPGEPRLRGVTPRLEQGHVGHLRFQLRSIYISWEISSSVLSVRIA